MRTAAASVLLLLGLVGASWEDDVRLLGEGDPAQRRAALGRLKEVEDPDLIVRLLEVAPGLASPLKAQIGRIVKDLARAAPEETVVDALLKSSAAAKDLSVALAADMLTQKRTAELSRRLVDPETAPRLAPLLARTGRPDALMLLLAAFESGDDRVRIAAAAALGRMAGFAGRILLRLKAAYASATPELRAAILGAAQDLGDVKSRHWLVTIALSPDLPFLKEVFVPAGRKDVLRELVKRLPDALDALKDLTGQNLPAEPSLWTRWVDSLDADTIASGTRPAPPREQRYFYGIPIPTGPFVFVLDASASMNTKIDGRARIRHVKDEVFGILDQLDCDRRFNVIFFNTVCRPFRGRTVMATAENVRLAKKWISRIKAMGLTNLSLGLGAALRDPEVTDILLLSDGAPNRGWVRTAEDVLKMINGRKVRIHTVALNPDRRLMKDIAEKTGGKCGKL